MNDSVKFWCFFLLIPFLVVTGHDVYANFFADPDQLAKVEALNIDPKSYQPSELGYLFVTYLPDFYEKLQKVSDIKTWFAWIDPVLRTYSFIVALIPFGVFLVWLVIARILNIWPFTDRAFKLMNEQAKSRSHLEERAVSKPFKFTRK